MPSKDLAAEFTLTYDRWVALGQTLASLAEQLAFQNLADVLPQASSIEVRGEMNEDWQRTLRIQRVFSAEGDVLFDVTKANADRRVEDAIDLVNAEHLDLLLDLTGDQYMGRHAL